MATALYAPVVAQPVRPVVVQRSGNPFIPLIPICCIGLTLFLIASTIVLSLIPVYLQPRGERINRNPGTVGYTAIYRLNNGNLVLGPLSAENCAIIQQDQRNVAAADNGVAPAVPTALQCVVTGNSTRRRRQAPTGRGNVIQINGILSGASNCLGDACLISRAQRFRELLLGRGTFFLTLVDTNGARIQFSITVISVTITPQTTATTNTLSNDIAILNYALILERLEANFYTRFQARFTAQDFIAANFTQQTYDYFNIIYVHELAHVRTLVAIINQLGGTPVSECTYNFSAVTDVKSYITVSRMLENTGTMAYAGAANGIADPVLRLTAATVATVEARHTSYINSLVGLSPFPTPFENATVPTVVIENVKAFIISCPFTITAPNVPYTGATSYSGSVPTSNDTNTSPYTSAMYTNDIRALNFALVSENLESTFYNQYVSNFTSADFTNNGFPDATSYFIMIREIENAHAQFLRMTITQRGGTPVGLCTYNFTVPNVNSFVRTSRTLENTGVKAYDGAINTISDPVLILAGATIATVEARFASYLNRLERDVPFPNVTDPTLTPPQVVAVLSAYQTCPFPLEVPVVLRPSTLVLNV